MNPTGCDTPRYAPARIGRPPLLQQHLQQHLLQQQQQQQVRATGSPLQPDLNNTTQLMAQYRLRVAAHASPNVSLANVRPPQQDPNQVPTVRPVLSGHHLERVQNLVQNFQQNNDVTAANTAAMHRAAEMRSPPPSTLTSQAQNSASPVKHTTAPCSASTPTPVITSTHATTVSTASQPPVTQPAASTHSSPVMTSASCISTVHPSASQTCASTLASVTVSSTAVASEQTTTTAAQSVTVTVPATRATSVEASVTSSTQPVASPLAEPKPALGCAIRTPQGFGDSRHKAAARILHNARKRRARTVAVRPKPLLPTENDDVIVVATSFPNKQNRDDFTPCFAASQHDANVRMRLAVGARASLSDADKDSSYSTSPTRSSEASPGSHAYHTDDSGVSSDEPKQADSIPPRVRDTGNLTSSFAGDSTAAARGVPSIEFSPGDMVWGVKDGMNWPGQIVAEQDVNASGKQVIQPQRGKVRH